MILSSVTAGVERDLSLGMPVTFESFTFHFSAPVALLTAETYPPQSGKYTVSLSTAGVAETSPSVVTAHLTASLFTFAALKVCSDGCERVFCRSPPEVFHSLPCPANALCALKTAMAAADTTIGLNINGLLVVIGGAN